MTKTHDYLQYYLQLTLLLRITIFAKINSEYNIKYSWGKTGPNIKNLSWKIQLIHGTLRHSNEKKNVKVDKMIYSLFMAPCDLIHLTFSSVSIHAHKTGSWCLFSKFRKSTPVFFYGTRPRLERWNVTAYPFALTKSCTARDLKFTNSFRWLISLDHLRVDINLYMYKGKLVPHARGHSPTVS